MSTPKSLLLIGLFAVLGLATACEETLKGSIFSFGNVSNILFFPQDVCDDLVEPLWDSYKNCGGGRCFCRYSDCGTHKCCFKVRDQYEDGEVNVLRFRKNFGKRKEHFDSLS